MERRKFGQVSRLRSKRWQARWKLDGTWYTARHIEDGYDAGARTFDTREDAEEHLETIEHLIDHGSWKPPEKRTARGGTTSQTFREYAQTWLAERELSPTTREHYAQLLRDHLFPTFGDERLDRITAASVRAWHAKVARGNPRARSKRDRRDRPVTRAHAYGLLRTILGDAVADELISANPCRIRKAGTAKTTRKGRIAELDELGVILRETPPEYRMLVQLCCWCALRYGEATELRRADIDMTAKVVRVRRGVIRTRAGRLAKPPKSEAGVRDVEIPPHLLDDLQDHLDEHVEKGKDALLFTGRGGGWLAPSSAYTWWYVAREAAGRPDLRIHDLRHTGLTLAAQTGATVRELMTRGGHSSPAVSARYQHEAAGRQRQIADAMSEIAIGNVVPIGAARKTARKATRRKEGNG